MVSFDWSYFWSYYQRVGYESVRQEMREESVPWLFDQPSETQIAVLKDAPKDLIESIKAQLKPDAVKKLSPEIALIDWRKI